MPLNVDENDQQNDEKEVRKNTKALWAKLVFSAQLVKSSLPQTSHWGKEPATIAITSIFLLLLPSFFSLNRIEKRLLSKLC
jgi:hypothetical protein